MYPVFHPAVIIYIRLCPPGNLCHGFYCFHRVKPRSAFTGKHDGSSPIINSVCNVRCLRPGRPWILNHGLQHLGSGNYMLALGFRHLDHLLLHNRDFFHRNFHSHVPPCHHYAVGYCKNLFQIADALHVLNFRNDFHMAVMVVQNFPDLQDILLTPYKGSRQEIKAHITAEHNIASVNFADIRHGQNRPRDIHALMVGNRPAVYHCTDNIIFFNGIRHHFNQTVVNQNGCPHTDIVFQILIGNGYFLIISQNFFGSQYKFLPCYQLRPAPLNIL